MTDYRPAPLLYLIPNNCYFNSWSAKHTNAIVSATSRATFGKMLFELWASVGPAGPQLKQICHKRRAERRADNRVGVFRAYNAGIDFSRQNLTSVDVRFWRLKSIPALSE